MKYAVVTFGCRVNQADSLAIEERLRADGGTPSPPEHADVVVVNSCSVTASADQGTRQTIRRIARANPAVQVIVTGCYATREPAAVALLPNVVRVVSNEDKDGLSVGGGDGDGPCGRALEPGVAGRTAFTLRVQTGCEESCSYCIIPRTRGASRSRPLASVADDLRRAVAAGYKEIVLTGVHLGSYGRDLGDRTSLRALVRMLADWDEEVLFRISSLEPMDCTDEIVDLVASSSRLAPHFHLPLQHGCDDVLRAMRRPYTVAYYRDLVNRIRASMPQAAIGSDIIAGFPGEEERHFEEMRRVLEELPLTHLHVFPYSDRPGTMAATLHPKVDGRDTRDRARRIRDVGAMMARRFRQSQIGGRRRALTVDDGRAVVTDNYLKLRLAEPRCRNEWVYVTVGDGDTAHIHATYEGGVPPTA